MLQNRSEPLAGLRVFETGGGIACAYAGKLLAAFGAEVVRLSVGDAGAQCDEVGRAYAAWLHADKRYATDLSPLAGARVLIVGLMDPGARAALDEALAKRSDPPLVRVDLSWFGEGGPYAGFAGSDAVCRALAGAVRSMGPVEGPPLLTEDGHLSVLTGTLAVVPALAGLFDTAPSRFAISTHEVGLLLSELETGQALTDGLRRPRLGTNRFPRNFPSGPYATKDGWIGVTVTTEPQWKALCRLLGVDALGSDPSYGSSPARIKEADALDAIIAPLFRARTTAEWFAGGRKLRLPLTPMPTVPELATHPVLATRGAFGEITMGARSFRAPVIPLHLNGTPPKRDARAPASSGPAGWLTGDEFASLGTRRDGLPLEGIRIVDLTMGWAGPLATKLLADLGAEVIKVESCVYPDWWRGKGSGPDAHEQNLWFHTMNRNKLGVTLDLKQPEGVAALRRLLANADAVIDNYASDVLPGLGLDQTKLAEEFPGLIVQSITCFGADSHWRDVRAYGTTMEQASGLPSMTGRESDPPTMCHGAYGDPVAGINAAAALLVALVHRKRSGRGQRVDLSAVECLLPLGAFRIIEQSLTGTTGPRTGNRHRHRAPHGAFRCADGEWLVVDVVTAPQWRALCLVIGRPDLAGDASLATAPGRLASQDRIEAAITVWTSTQPSLAAMRALQAKGVPAGAVLSPVDLKDDPQLAARGYWQETVNRFIGPHRQPSSPIRIGAVPLPVRRPAPTLGQHGETILREVAGLATDEIADLARAGVIGQTPRK